MSRPSTRCAVQPARHVASTPAVAGFRPAGAAMAIAAAFGMQPVLVQAQPTGAQAIHGTATLATSGNRLTVTTTNGAHTNHSAINWQSFSVPKDTVTHFQQPTATSTSINRVVGPNPSATQRNITEIYGTLSSNGRLVLVNPQGIAIGKGGMVDTAGFTASTLAMSKEDAIAARLRFGGGTAALQVDGTIRASGGDIVLIAPKVETGAESLVRSDGAVVLAAGQKAEITGRGLEGIHLELQAGSEAVNLGKLQGDAVGIFAGTLRHSGHVLAQAVSTEGGKVVLKAAGDALVNGTVTASAGTKGGNIDVLGQRVGLLAGTTLEASGDTGGGQIRVGGDYQGKNADLPNAARTYVDAQAGLRADAGVQGDGGRVIVWSDELTRMHGQISARGGAQGGNGGFAEASGKQYLEFTGRADLRAPNGAAGLLLLDPEDVTIVHHVPAPSPPPADPTSNTFPIATPQGAEFAPSSTAPVTLSDARLNSQLSLSNVRVTTSSTVSSGTGGQITLNPDAIVTWDNTNQLSLRADKGIRLDGTIRNTPGTLSSPSGGLHLEALAGGILGSGVIEVGALWASAVQNTSTDPDAGKVRLTNVANKIGRIAGLASGSASEFTVVNAQGLTVDAVDSTNYPGGSGITANTISLTTLTGPLSIRPNNDLIGVGGITLEGRTDVLIDSNLYATSGLLKAHAGHDLLAATTVSGALMQMSANEVELRADNNLVVGNLLPPPPSASPVPARVFIDGSTGLTLQAGHDLRFETTSTSGGTSGAHQVRSQGTGSTGVHIDATAGALDFGASTYVQATSGGIDAHAGTSLLGGGTYFATQLAGSVHLTASAGSLSFGAINSSSGSFSGNAGGEVRLRATGVAGTSTRGDISGGSIFTNGTYSGGTGARNGGAVDILATGGDVHIAGGISTAGAAGNGAIVNTPGGTGGAIRVEATAQSGPSTGSLGGSITLDGALDSSGGPGIYGGGAAGNITLRAMQGSISAEANIFGSGGSATNTESISSAGGGAGATITIDAGGNIQLGQLQAAGGTANRTDLSAPAVTAGAGGTVHITSTSGNIALGRILDGSVISAGGAMVNGGVGFSLATGGAGGGVTLSAMGPGGQISMTDTIDTRGGDAGENGGGTGAPVIVNADNSIRLGNVYSSGGYDWNYSTSAGPITIASTSGSIELAGQVQAVGRTGGVIDVSTGGEGAVITVQSLVDASAQYSVSAGVAPNGGTIRLTSSEGGVTVNGSLYARAGYTSSTAATGGSITIEARDDVAFGYLYATGVSFGPTGGGTGGTVHISSRLGNVVGTHVDASGPSGGTVDIRADVGNIQLGSANAEASRNASFGLAGGGTGGTILLTALGTGEGSGNITVTDGLDANGGMGFNRDGGAGGTITIKADKQVAIDYARATGGRVSTGSATGGMGGKVAISSVSGGVSVNREIDVTGGSWGNSNTIVTGGAGGDVAISAPGDINFYNLSGSFNFVSADGGAGQEAAGGHGGTVTIESRAGQVAYVPPAPPPATDEVTLLAATSTTGGISASGGHGAPGGAGGTVDIRASGPISIPGVLATGGLGSSSLGGAGGGMGGTILLTAGSGLSATAIDASGGNGESARTGPSDGGSGGQGGSVTVTQNAGDLNLSGVGILAEGGLGGDATGTDGLGGVGGNGGSVLLNVAAGSLTMAGGRLSATGGSGGVGSDDTRATDGGLGSVTALAANAIDMTGADLGFGRASFTARAGGSIDVSDTITTRGGAVTLSAGDPGAPAPDANAHLNVGASIITSDEGEFAAGAEVNLQASGVMTLATPLPSEGPPDNSVIVGSTVAIGAAQVLVGSTTSVIGFGGVAVRTDGLVLDGFLDSDMAQTTIEARSSTRAIHLGGTDEAGTLNLTQAELDRIIAGRLVVGSLANMGGLVVDTPITIDAGRIPELGLINGAAVSQSAAATLVVGALGVKGGSVVLDRVTASGPVLVVSDTSLQLRDQVSSSASGDAVVLSAVNLNAGPAGAISTPAGRWLVYLSGPLSGNNFGTVASNNLALWNRTFTGSPPGTVSESGNRYLFAFQPSLSVTANSFSRVYDGTLVTHAGYSASGLVDASAFGNVFLQDTITGDLTVLNPSKNVGSYAIKRGTLQPPAGYAFSFTEGTGSITPRDLHVGVQAQSKVYDGTTAAAVAVSSDDRVSGDALGFGVSGSFSDKNAGTGKTVNLFGYSLAGADAGNYTLVAPASTTASISQLGLLVAVSARDKVYDATTSATLDESDNRVAGDALSVAVSGSFSDKNAGSGKTVNLGGYGLSGADAGNYFISSSPSFTLASITQRSLAVQAQAQNKVYDGTTAAAATASAQPLAGDSVTVDVNASFADKNAGTAKPVSLSFSLSGADAGNYALPASTGSTTADIARRSLQVGVAARDKTYDATTAASTSVTDNRVAGDALTVGVNASFNDKNVGTAKPVSLAGYALSGADAGNYVLANAPGSTSASITPAPLTVAADNLAKAQGDEYVFKGTEFSATGLQGGEAITRVSLSSAGAPAAAPTGAYSIVPSNPVGGNGYQASNYAISLLNGVLAVGSPQAEQQVSNQVVSFANLFVQEAQAQQRQDKKENQVGQDDIVITDTSCKPS
jgi:filamentous hemagglutinin family protein